MSPCPLCGSDMIYPLLNTLRCKRCKHIWKVGDGNPAPCRCPDLDPSIRVRKKTDPLETRLERRLEELLARHGGKFCISAMACRYGNISLELFRNYLRQCVTNRTLEETKDTHGRVWYSRPG
jgi:hypothetical protein